MEYKVSNDLKLIRDFFEISQSDLSKELKVEKLRIARTELGETKPREELLQKIYGYCFNKGLRLNEQKEMFYKDDINKNHILLTHSSRKEIDGEISNKVGREKNDFGQGFYCGDSYEKSIAFVCRFPESCVYFIDFDPTDLKCVSFSVEKDWMIAIAYFRGRLKKYENHPIVKKIIDKILDADYIIAPIVDNRMFQIIDSFIESEITDEQCKHCLAATNLGLQYVFKSDKSIKKLKILERCFVSSVEKDYYKEQQVEFQKIGNDKSKLARIQYKNKGKYIEEILV